MELVFHGVAETAFCLLLMLYRIRCVSSIGLFLICDGVCFSLRRGGFLSTMVIADFASTVACAWVVGMTYCQSIHPAERQIQRAQFYDHSVSSLTLGSEHPYGFCFDRFICILLFFFSD